MALSINRISFEHHRSGFGIPEARPHISWRFEGNATNWEQDSYVIEVGRLNATAPASFTVESNESLYVAWPAPDLEEGKPVQVRVQAHGHSSNGNLSTPWSDWVAVEAALLNGWDDVRPITTVTKAAQDEPKRPIYFRKEVDIPEDMASARLYVTALGLYETEINGQRVGDAVLAPGWQSYHNRHVYDTYNVTTLLHPGPNAIGGIVGEGWFAGRLGFGGGTRNIYGDEIGLMAILKITLKDGSVQSFPTDESWQSIAAGPILSGEIYNGEEFDDTVAAANEGWSTVGFHGRGWGGVRAMDPPRGQLVAPDQPPIRRSQEVHPQRIFQSPSGKTLIDFGQNLVGWLRLKVNGPEGTTISLRHAEVLQDGELALRPLRLALAEDKLHLSGRAIEWEPRFTFHGFRYAQVDGWPSDTPLDATAITAIVVHTDLEETGFFDCSNNLLNKFHSNVKWSMKGNFLSIPTDCPQRDERLGWTGDAHIFGPTSNFLYDTGGFWKSWHWDVWSEMSKNPQKAPYAYVPTIPAGFSGGGPTAVWGDVVVGNPWSIWQSFGDRELLRAHLPQSQTWIDSGIKRNEDGLWDRSTFQFGDWLDPLSPPDDPGKATTDAHLVADAYLVRMTQILADISQALGDPQMADRYRGQRSDLRDQFEAAWMKDGVPKNDTQTAYALALAFDLFKDAGQSEKGVQRLRQLIKDNGYLVGTGFAGTTALGTALKMHNATDDFYQMLLATKVPSWLYQVVQGGTTTWERWDSLLPNGTINPGEMTSFNHYAFGSVADWMHQVIGGITPAEPGYKRVKVAPVPGGGINRASARLLSPYGEISTAWEVTGNCFHLRVSVPPNAKADVLVPGMGEAVEIGSGSYEFKNEGCSAK